MDFWTYDLFSESSPSPAVAQVLNFGFSLFCFFASFCCSIYLLDLFFSLWTFAAKRIKLRPYSPTFIKLERQLQYACESEDSEIWCLRNKRLSLYEFKELVVPLLTQPKARRWRSLHLESNDFGDSGSELLFRTLAEEACACDLEFLSLKQCGIQHLPTTFRDYLRSERSTLRQLDLSGNELDDEQVARLATCLPSSELRMLDLSRNRMTPASMSILGNAVAESRLEELRLRGNNLRDEGVALLVATELRARSKLKYLDLSANTLSDTGVLSLARMMQSSCLHELNVMDNPLITDASLSVLASTLRRLRVLNISKLTSLTDRTARALVDSAKHSVLRRVIRFGVNLSPESEHEMTRIFHLVGSRTFQVIVVLCAAIDVKRVGINSPLRLLPKDLIRFLAEEWIGVKQPFIVT